MYIYELCGGQASARYRQESNGKMIFYYLDQVRISFAPWSISAKYSTNFINVGQIDRVQTAIKQIRWMRIEEICIVV